MTRPTGRGKGFRWGRTRILGNLLEYCNLATRSSMYVYLRVYILALAQGIIYAQTPLFLHAITSNDMKMHRPISELKYLTYLRSSILI